MLNAAVEVARRQKGLKRFAFASTSEVYAGTLEHGELAFPSPETSKLVLPDLGSPRTSYMLSKLYGEAMCRAAGIPVTMFRPHNVYGPRMGLSHVIPELLQRAYQARDGDQLVVHSVEHRRTFCYIDDAVEFIWRVTEAPGGEGDVFNVGVEEPEVSIGALAELITETVGRQLAIVPGEVTAGSPTRRAPDTSKIRAVTGHSPQVDLAQGVSRTFDWYRSKVFDADGVPVR
jgi:nucleoside-diphosphate-sugar epimerase